MNPPSAAHRTALISLVICDTALLAAVFYSPIIWGAFNTGGHAFAAISISVAALAAMVAHWSQGKRPALLPNAIHLPAFIFVAISALSAARAVSLHASAIEFSRIAIGVLLFLLVANRAVLPAPPASTVAAAFACSFLVLLFVRVPGESNINLTDFFDPSRFGEIFTGVGKALRLFTLISLAAVAGLIASDRDRPRPTKWYASALIASAAFAVAIYGLREKVIAVTILKNASWQIFSTFFNPNPLAGFLGAVFLITSAAALSAVLFWQRLLWIAAALLLVGAIVPTNSKGGALALAVAAVVFTILAVGATAQRKRNLRVLTLVAIVAVMGVGLVIFRAPSLRARLIEAGNPRSASNMFRILAWEGTGRMALANPALGIGPGGFKYTFMKYAIGGYTEAAHQNYLQIAAEQGFPGLAVFLWMLGAAIFTARRALRHAPDFRSRIPIIGAISGLTVMLAHSFLDYDLYIGAIGLTFWLILGLIAHFAHGREAAPALFQPQQPAQSKGRRRVLSQAATVASTQETGARFLPWPSTPAARASTLAVFAIALCLLTFPPLRNALASNTLRFGDSARAAGHQAHERQEGMAMRSYFDTALDDYRRAKELDPGWSVAWERYGLILGTMGRGGEAEKAIRKALALEPTNFQPHLSVARLSYEQGQYGKAAAAYRESLARYPNNTRALRHLGATYQQLGDTENALTIYRRMVEVENSPYNKYRALADIDVDTEYAYAHYQLGRAALKDYRATHRTELLETAVGEFKAVCDIVLIYQTRGKQMDEMFRLVGQPRENRLVDLQELEARTRWRLAAVYEKVGKGGAAGEEREQALRLLPDVSQAVLREDSGRVMP